MPDGLTPVVGDSGAAPSQQEFTGELNLGESDDTPAVADESPSGSPETDDSSTEPGSQGEVAAVIPGQPVAQPFKFYGRDWDSEEAATQHFRSMDGRIRAQGQELQEVTGLVRRWNDWYQAEQLKKEEAAKVPEKGEPYLDAIDWNSVNAIAEKAGPVAGMKAAILQLGDHLNQNVLAGVRSEIAEARRPNEEARHREESDNYAKGWLYNAAMHVDPLGNPTFPELHEGTEKFSPEVARQTLNNWGQLVRAYPEFGMSRDGLDLCLAKAKQTVGVAGTKSQAAKTAAGEVVRNAQGRFVKQSEATVGDEAEGGTGATASSSGEQPAQSASEAEQRRAIKNAGLGKDNATARFLGVV